MTFREWIADWLDWWRYFTRFDHNCKWTYDRPALSAPGYHYEYCPRCGCLRMRKDGGEVIGQPWTD